MQTSSCTHGNGHRTWPVNVPGGRQQTRAAVVRAAVVRAAVVNPPAVQQSPHVQQLSTVMLVNENLRRRLGRGLVQPEQLLQALEIVQQADYAVVVARLQPPAAHAQQQPDSSLQDMQCQVAFANHAAADLLCQQGQQQPLEIPLAAAVAAVSHQYSGLRQQQGQRGEQKLSSLQVFEAVPWRLAADTEVTVDQVLVCPVDAPNGTFLGLALLFDRWSYPIDGCIGAPGYPHVSPSELPTDQLLQGAADAVRQQADAVRQLKQARGLSNKDPEVAAAVSELQQFKQQLVQLEGLQATFQRDRHGVFQELLIAYYNRQQQW